MRPLTYAVSASFVLLTAVVVFRVFVRKDYQRRGRLTFASSALGSVSFALLGYFLYIDSLSFWPPPVFGSLHGAVGWSVLTAGLSVTLIIMAWFGFRRAFGVEVSRLVQAGPYRVTRNPQVLTCGVAVIGYALFWPSWHTAGWVILYAAIAHLMVVTEEEHLRLVFGDAYVAYCKRVPRYIAIGRWTSGFAA